MDSKPLSSAWRTSRHELTREQAHFINPLGLVVERVTRDDKVTSVNLMVGSRFQQVHKGVGCERASKCIRALIQPNSENAKEHWVRKSFKMIFLFLLTVFEITDSVEKGRDPRPCH